MKTISSIYYLIFYSITLYQTANSKSKDTSKDVIYNDLELVDEGKIFRFKNFSEEYQSFSDSWNERIKDFDADFSQNFKLNYNEEDVFYDEVKFETHINGAFATNEDNKIKLLFRIEDPNGNIIYSYVGRKLVYNKNITTLGTYLIRIKNISKKPALIKFIYSSNQTKIISKSDIDKPSILLHDIQKEVDNVSLLFKFKKSFNTDKYKKTGIMILVSLIQFYYIKNYLKDLN